MLLFMFLKYALSKLGGFAGKLVAGAIIKTDLLTLEWPLESFFIYTCPYLELNDPETAGFKELSAMECFKSYFIYVVEI